MDLTPANLTELLVAAIAALPTDAWLIGDYDGGVWHEARTPYGATAEPAPEAHLAFMVQCVGSRPFIYESGVLQTERTSRFDIAFIFGLDPADQMGSFRLAQRAAEQLVELVVNHHAWADDGIAAVDLVEAFNPLVGDNGLELLVRQTYDIRHDMGAPR